MRTMRCFTLPIAGAERDNVHHPRRTLPDGVEDDGRVSCRRHVVDAYLISPPPPNLRAAHGISAAAGKAGAIVGGFG